jgi:RNA polymerase sigma-70 factor (ECF subfamily)
MNNKQSKTDKKLVLDYQSGDAQALPILVKRWHKVFCEKAYWLVKDADVAKDIAQDSWGIIVSKINDLKKPESFGSWGSRIVYTKSLDWIKANKRLCRNLESYKYEQDIFNLETTGNASLKNGLLKTIKTLPNNQQVVIRLFYVQEYPLKEISDILNISVGTVKSRLFHAREKLKETLKYKDYEN